MVFKKTHFANLINMKLAKNKIELCQYFLLIIYIFFFIFSSEKSIRKLNENFACYADKLHEPEVYQFFSEIISNFQKTVKPEVKSLVEELEKRIVERHEKGVEDENTAKKAVHAKLKGAGNTGRKTCKCFTDVVY